MKNNDVKKDNKERSDEREFLHDVASPLGAALFAVTCVLDSLKDKESDPFEIEQLSIANDSLERLKVLLNERRSILIQQGVPSARG